MSTICVTCLSRDRHLLQLQNLLVYTNIWNDISLQMTDYICWECKAMFNNIWRFKQRVLTAQDVLRNQNLTEIPKVNQCLSKLTKSIKTSYDSEYYEDNVIKTEPPSVDYLDDTIIKKEILFTVDCSHTEPMKTEIEDTELNISDKIEIEIYSDSRENITNETELPNVSAVQTQLEFNMYQPSNTEKQFIINVMTEDELLKARESDRELTKYKDSTYKCEKCIVAFVSEEPYKNHYVKHTAERGEFLCKICNVHFITNSSCKTHTLRHYLSYQCKVCDFKSHRINEMTAHHSKEHEGPKTFRCDICNAEFNTAGHLRNHHNKEHTERTTCTICKKQYSSTGYLNSHMLIHKRLQPTVECEICKKQVIYIKQHMLTHRKVEADENAFCAECNIQYKSVAIYKIHLKDSSKHVPRDKFPYICAECGRKFMNKNSLVYHLNAIHYNKKDFVCKICNKGFIKGYHLKNHMLYTHEGVSKPRKYICSYCDRGFTIRAVLDNHIRTHTGEKPFECRLCDSKFTQEAILRTHMKGVHKKLFRRSEH